MSRRDVSCRMGHTALYPHKNDVRSECMRKVPTHKDIITVSHGLLDVANILRHQGRILIGDIDPGVIESAHYIRIGDPRNGRPSDYPKLNFLPEQCGDIRGIVRSYLQEYGCSRLGAIDLDLTGTIHQVWPVACGVFQALSEFPKHNAVSVFLTYRNGRDNMGRNAHDLRVKELERLAKPLGVMRTWHEHYRSDWIGRLANREPGSSMTIVSFKFMKNK